MVDIYFARHGQTDWNSEDRFQGQHDVPLNELGRRQAEALRDRLQGIGFSQIYSSDLGRARETARIIARDQQAEIILDHRLREMNFGAWEGMTYQNIQEEHPDELQDWENDLLRVRPPGGESLEQLGKRVMDFYRTVLVPLKEEQQMLVVGHGGSLQGLLCHMLEHDLKKYWQFHLAPAAFSWISLYEPGGILNLHNDRCHLQALDSPRGDR